MSVLVLVAVALAGGVGAALRFLADTGVSRLIGSPSPLGIVAVNLVGSFSLGLLVGASGGWVSPQAVAVLGTGLLGGFTTFSTASLDTVALLREGRVAASFVHAGATLAGCVALAAIGIAVAS